MNVQKNDIVTVTIEDIENDGLGIGRTNEGFTLFVKDAVMGDTVQAKILKLKKNYGFAKLEKVVTPSPFRVQPPCPFHRQCGGCQLQALSYEKQLMYKQAKIRNNLIRIGGFSPDCIDACMESIVGMENPLRYRNKAQYPVGTDREGRIVAGFYAGRTHTIVPNTDCLLETEENREILQIILDHLRRHHISAYDENTGKGLVRHILIRKGFTSREIMVCLILNHRPVKKLTQASFHKPGAPVDFSFLEKQNELLQKLSQVEGMTSVSVNLNTERTNVIMGKEVYTIWGKPAISDTIHVRDMTKPGYPFTGKELTFSISPLSFYQVNPVQTEKLYSLALEFAGLTGRETVWDLYCGIGTISLFLAQRAGKVYGVEVIPQAVSDARINAERNGIKNAEFFLGKAGEPLETAGHPDVIVVDPPRKGCDEICLNTIWHMQPDKIVYVSCDSATLARDLKILCGGGYEIKRIRGVDQFGMTVHVETVVQLYHQKSTEYFHVDYEPKNGDYLDKMPATATYREIKQWVYDNYNGMKVSSLYVAQIKQKYGIIERECYNKRKLENARVPQCPSDKKAAIEAALKHFKMI